MAAHQKNEAVPDRGEEGFQTAEAIGIAAVGIIVLIAVATALESLGIEVIAWMRDSLLQT